MNATRQDYDDARKVADRASAMYRAVCNLYRRPLINDLAYLAARAVYEVSVVTFDRAFDIETVRQETEEATATETAAADAYHQINLNL